MSTGGVFQLITNDGAQDRLLMATALLNQRLREIKRIRCKNPAIRDTTPTLTDIERTHVLYINANFKPFVAIGYEYQSTQAQFGIVSLGNEIAFSIPQFGDFFHDMVLNVELSSFSAAAGDQVYYTDFVGHRLMQLVQFEVNGNFLDQYDSNVMNFHYNFTVPDYKKRAWLQAIGQEIPESAYLTANPGVDEYRQQLAILSGPQTPKATQPTLSLWIPLLFWFNCDVRLSIPSVAVPYGQRFIYVQFATASQICASVNGTVFTPPNIIEANLYINNIFVNPEVHDIFIRRVGFVMIRVHLQQSSNENVAADQLLLNQMKFPIETLYVGLQPTINLTGPDNMTDWHKYYNVATTLIPMPVAIANSASPPFPPYVLAFSQAIWRSASPTIDTMEINNHGVELYYPTPSQFFSQYVPYKYGGKITAPYDIGMSMITFNLFPGGYQPSGHFNLSQARDTYLNWTGATISTSNPAIFQIIGIAINFLLIAEGTCILRFNV
jgi:hypothetical protein